MNLGAEPTESELGGGAAHDSDEQVRVLRAELASMRRELKSSRDRLDAAQGQVQTYVLQLKALRASSSWRITRPMRALRRRTLGRGQF